MGQKVNPHGLRVGVIKDWDSRWYARNEKVGDLLVEDKKIRDYLKKTLYGTGIPKIEIERDNTKVRIYRNTARYLHFLFLEDTARSTSRSQT